MNYVIIRDDDTNAFTPVACLERLYRPFLNAGLPVNLAVIPDVSLKAAMADGQLEPFLRINSGETNHTDAMAPSHAEATTAVLERARTARLSPATPTRPIGDNPQLVSYLQQNPGYHIVQHGCHHEYSEFDRRPRCEIASRLDRGAQALRDAGFARPQTFVAPHDRISRAGLLEVRRRFDIFSTGWFELRRLPCSWWPRYLFKKIRHAPHWRVGRTQLLSHPGCLLSYQRAYSTMLGGIFHYLKTQRLTVLVTHWWEYFRDNQPDEPFIGFLHETAAYLASHPHLKVISFADLINRRIPLN